MLNNKSVLITGGTGSFGKKLTERLLNKYPKINRLIIFSRDELKQYEIKKKIDTKKYSCLRFFLGDIRDKERLKRSLEGVDYVFHAAALKQVDTAEYNPFEFIKTNIIGSNNLIEACLDSSVKKVLALSTDKASSPINLYGATKLCADKLFAAANNVVGKKKISFSVLRYGNVLHSRGSVLPLLIEKLKNNQNFKITDEKMTRFNIELDQAIDLSIECLKNMIGGEIFVPKLKSYKILDLANALNKKNKIEFIGIRPGEKLHEEMISKIDSLNTYDLGKKFAIIDPASEKLKKNYSKYKKMKKYVSYNSHDNDYLTVKELKKIVEKYK
ncbi:UDP-N-acetylglucosamine 4,6-dehydratase (inverting) [Candidatus Pelagibacter sp.]|nr:UDP-N-acetylglucosamine 4,6-dehydratase (inverting) [Candidatus Pelagibacter sp.]